jgi:hypothetical protein
MIFQQKNKQLIKMRSKFTRNIYITSLITLFGASATHAQPPVTSGLKLYLDNAPINFTPATNSTPAKWIDNSGAGNDVFALTAANSPTLSTGTNAGVVFDGTNQIMINASLNSTFATTKSTIFVVRIAESDTVQDQVLSSYKTTVSIGEDNSWNNEFIMIANVAAHHSSSGNWTEKRHQCYSSLPATEPAIITGIFESNPNLTGMQVNGIASTSTMLSWGSPWNYDAANRRIRIGGRTPYGSPGYFFEGKMLEVLAYDHVLTQLEIADVTDYLKCKYSINYTTCNEPIDCTTGINDNSNLLKKKNILFQNTSNPFVDETTVQFYVDDMKDKAFITVYNPNGKELRRYPIMHEGKGSIKIVADDLAQGLYFYSLVIDGAKIDTKRMILSK